MTTTATRLMSGSIPVTDQDAALALYVDVLGCEVRVDRELWPGARWVEVVPPGSDVGIALLTEDSGLPVGVRFGTGDADAAHTVLEGAHTEALQEVLNLDFARPMFALHDPDGNLLVLIEEQQDTDAQA